MTKLGKYSSSLQWKFMKAVNRKYRRQSSEELENWLSKCKINNKSTKDRKKKQYEAKYVKEDQLIS